MIDSFIFFDFITG